MHFEPPSGNPLGTNRAFRFGALLVIPILKLLTKRSWNGIEVLSADNGRVGHNG